jgi:UDP-N-acetylglucosamine 2-epimerase (non-hydrolysing)
VIAKVSVVLGTRPEIIKLAPVIKRLGSRVRTVFTGQHYDENLSGAVFQACGLRPPEIVLTSIGGRDRADQISGMLTELTELFRQDRPSAVVVQGDTNSASAGAQAAHYLGIPVIHVEAGLRSFDRNMPEEINRLVIGAVADVHCCATERNAAHLLAGGTPASSVFITGNTIVEATRMALGCAPEPAAVVREYGLQAGEFVLATLHRPENADDSVQLERCLASIASVGLPVLMPLHPRTRNRLRDRGTPIPPSVRLVEPTDHPTFLALAMAARLLISDSGGVQEEVTVLGKPLVVLRNSTERPEAVTAGFAILAGPSGVRAAAEQLLRPGWPEYLQSMPSPFGDGEASRRIAALAAELVDGRSTRLAA